MKKNKLVVAGSLPFDSLSACACLDWKICCLCQQNNNKTVICPAKNPIEQLREKGYETLAANLEQIHQFTYKLPSGFAIDALDNGTGIAATLIKEKALWHKDCSLKYTNPKRLQSLIGSLETPSVSTSAELIPKRIFASSSGRLQHGIIHFTIAKLTVYSNT
ncbi:hypothetical protein FQR65_LT15706 [Abscondita terminalis]|nr:hypothetical protein FQR65_LT15706 [Abscondita terminalis]